MDLDYISLGITVLGLAINFGYQLATYATKESVHKLEIQMSSFVTRTELEKFEEKLDTKLDKINDKVDLLLGRK
jgi:hypothetical protein